MYDFAQAPATRRHGAIKRRSQRTWRKPALALATSLVLGLVIWAITDLWSSTADRARDENAKPLDRQIAEHKIVVPTPSLAPQPRISSAARLQDALLPARQNKETSGGFQEDLPDLPKVEEPYAFYNLLNQPPAKRDIQPEVWNSSRIYTVKTMLLRTRELALALRAQLFFKGYTNVVIQTEWFNQREAYRIVVGNILSRSDKSKLVDFFTDKEIETNSSFRNR